MALNIVLAANTAKFFGDTQPIADDVSKDGKAYNLQVELVRL